jgi:hypothetical protein
MALTLTSPAQTTALTSLGAVQRALGVGAEAEPLLTPLIAAASAAIVRFCGRTFARAVYSETPPGYGDLLLMLSATPVVALASVTLDGAPITDALIEDADAGLLYRRDGWVWTAGRGWNLTEYVVPRSELPSFAVAYTAGYLLPGDDVVSASVAVTAPSTYSGPTMPLLVAGERVVARDFATAANNGTFTVASRTATTLVVTAVTLGNETAPTGGADLRTLAVRTLPEDLEQACVETVTAWYLARTRDRTMTSQRIGDLSVTYAGTAADTAAIPWTAQRLLAPWQRIAVAA